MGPVHHGMSTLLSSRPQWVIEQLVRLGLIPADLDMTPLRTEAAFRRSGGQFDEGRTDTTLLLRPPGAELSVSAWRTFHQSGVIGVLIEVQLRFDENRLDAWEAMPQALRMVVGRHQWLVLVTLDDDVGAHLREELDNLTLTMRIFVISPSKVPRIDHPDPSRLEETLLNAMFHVRTPADLPLLDAALQALESIDGEREMIYREMLFSHLKEIESMSSVIHKYEEMDRRWPGYEPTKDELNSYLYVRGHRFGRKEGIEEGRQEGRQEGCLLGQAQAVLHLLRVRGLDPSPELESTVLACRDGAQLETWLSWAIRVDRPEQLLDVGSGVGSGT